VRRGGVVRHGLSPLLIAVVDQADVFGHGISTSLTLVAEVRIAT
jgi:hypothetical protein